MQPIYQRLAAQSLRRTALVSRIAIQQTTRRIPLSLHPSHQFRLNSSTTFPNAARGALPHKPAPHRNPDEPVYQLTFTCKPCKQRSSHTISKQGYHKGTVLITCPQCRNRHLIADHLKIFSDTRVTIEDIMKMQGKAVQRGTISGDGDVEFWSDDAQPVGSEVVSDDDEVRKIG